MNISVNTYNCNFQADKRLIPLAQYKGPILKLTRNDKAKIAQYRKTISSLELDTYKLEALAKKSKSAKETSYFFDKIQRTLFEIEKLREKIREIKIARFNKQKATTP